MAKLIDKFGITVVVDDEKAEKLLSLGYKKADEPKPQRKRVAKKEQ